MFVHVEPNLREWDCCKARHFFERWRVSGHAEVQLVGIGKAHVLQHQRGVVLDRDDFEMLGLASQLGLLVGADDDTALKHRSSLVPQPAHAWQHPEPRDLHAPPGS